MKACSACTRWKPLSAFYVDHRPQRSRDGRHHACIDCERAAAAQRARARYVPRNTMRQARDDAGRFARAA